MASASQNASIVSGNISASMRNNYEQHGVAEYYKKVGATYRNPHYPGIRLCLFSWFNRWWQINSSNTVGITLEPIIFFDMACGFGEATLAFVEWCNVGKKLYHESLSVKDRSSTTPIVIAPRRNLIIPIALGPEFPRPHIIAADPFTAVAYKQRTSYTCAKLSFSDIAEGALPILSVDISTGSVQKLIPQEDNEQTERHHIIEMVVCSFALHLLEDASSLFSLLWELSSKARWLVVLAPHKKPEIKSGWGWMKWNIDSWRECPMTDSAGELLHERVHCRIYRSLNLD
ncbi:hypothetical protein BYT27DRAFT_7202557 [Phlegmacium glaucopus]|nr:hypothetical protein BYT27DRAFT_7202557 [Phlegmacium glaucopus]